MKKQSGRTLRTALLVGICIGAAGPAVAEQYVMKVAVNGLQAEQALEMVNGAYQYNRGKVAATCQDYQSSGAAEDAKYRVDTNQDGAPEVVDCLMTVQGGGWTCSGYEKKPRYSQPSGYTIYTEVNPTLPSYADQGLTRSVNYISTDSSDDDTLKGYLRVGSYSWDAVSDNYNSSSVRTVNSLDTSVRMYLTDTENNDRIRFYADIEYCFR
jgi:hypothetical protein